MDEAGESQISEIDPDSRLMKNNQKMEVCYNVQTSVDEKNKLIVEYEVTNEVSDLNQLGNIAIKTQEALDGKEFEVLADKGYYSSLEIKKCIDNGITPYVSKPESALCKEIYKTEMFLYNVETDRYICPENKELTYKKNTTKRDRVIKVYGTKECKDCKVRDKCTKNKSGREIQRWEHEELLEEMQTRIKNNPAKYFQRRCLSEHPFGTIKRTMNAAYLLMKGFEKVRAEISLLMLSYNIKRVLKIIGVRKMKELLA